MDSLRRKAQRFMAVGRKFEKDCRTHSGHRLPRPRGGRPQRNANPRVALSGRRFSLVQFVEERELAMHRIVKANIDKFKKLLETDPTKRAMVICLLPRKRRSRSTIAKPDKA